MTGTEVERVDHHGVGALEHFVVGKVLDAPSSTPTPTGCSVCRSTSATASPPRSSAARRTSPPARRSRSRGPAR